jgi:hypothetical protein
LKGVEAGWALARAAWGFGCAAEAARVVVLGGFERLGFDEILAFLTGGGGPRWPRPRRGA